MKSQKLRFVCYADAFAALIPCDETGDKNSRDFLKSYCQFIDVLRCNQLTLHGTLTAFPIFGGIIKF